MKYTKYLILLIPAIFVFSAHSEELPVFNSCQPGLIGDYVSNHGGYHQIIGQNTQVFGDDDIFFNGKDGYVQCYCDGTNGIQTNWWKTELAPFGNWAYEANGLQWNLGDFHYLAQNINYNCSPVTPPEPPVVPPSTPPSTSLSSPPTMPPGNGPPCALDGTCPCIGLQGKFLENCLNPNPIPLVIVPVPPVVPPIYQCPGECKG